MASSDAMKLQMNRPSKAAWRIALATAAHRHSTALLVVGIALGVLALGWLVLVAAPSWFIDDDSLDGLKAENDVRGTLLLGIAGAIGLVGVYFTYQQVRAATDQARAATDQQRIAREGQITERYTRAIDQLSHDKLEVRLGGLYALERIARDSPTDRQSIAEVLTAFIRTHSAWPPIAPGQYLATAPIDQVPHLQVRAPDVQAVLTVLGRGGFAALAEDAYLLDLSATDLRRAVLNDAILPGADFSGAALQGAHFSGADLKAADFSGADLRGASLYEAHLHKANFHDADLHAADLMATDLRRAVLNDADLQGAALVDADLQGAYLVNADLQGADLVNADLRRADLHGADLRGANLSRADLRGASPYEADLRGANLSDANLQGAYLHHANLQGVDFVKADLEGADLFGADLQAACFFGADLEGADLHDANLQGAMASAGTTWPNEFDWRGAGIILIAEDDEENLPAEQG